MTEVRSPLPRSEMSLRQRVLAEVESAGPPLCTVPLSHGLKDNKVLLPATTFERLVDTVQFSCVPDPKRGRTTFGSKAYRVASKPQDVHQMVKRFPFPADRAGMREDTMTLDSKPLPVHGRKQAKESSLTEADFLAIRQPKERVKEASAKKAALGKRRDPVYCASHKPRPDILPSTVREAVAFPTRELLLSMKQLQMARSGETQVMELNPGPDLSKALPVIGLYNPSDRVPIRCGWQPLELTDKLVLCSPLDSQSQSGRRTPNDASPDNTSRGGAASPSLGFFLTNPHRFDSQSTKPHDPSTTFRLPAINERRSVHSPVTSEGSVSDRAGKDEDAGALSSLFANDFQGMRAIINALNEICPLVIPKSNAKKRRHRANGERPGEEGHRSPGACSEDDDADSEGDHDNRTLRKSKGSSKESDESSSASDPNDEAQCVVCMARAQQRSLRHKADVEVVLTHPTNVDSVLGNWKGMFVNSKLHCNEALLDALERRRQKRDAVYQSPTHLSKVARKAVADACQWSLSRNFSDDNRKCSGSGNPSQFTLWSGAGQLLQDERDHTTDSIVFYMRLALFLDALRSPTQDAQVAVVADIRQYLITGGQIHRQLLFRILSLAGPSVLESREVMKLIHFIRMELRVSLEKLIHWVRAKPRKQQGWKLTNDLVALWDKIRTGTEPRTGPRGPQAPSASN